MRRLLPAVFLAAALWLVPATSSAEVLQNMTVPLNQLVFNPCTGDTILFSGNIHIVIAETPGANGGFHFHVDVNVSNVTGVGAPSGIDYQGVGGFWTEFNAEPPFPVNATATNVFALMSQGPSPNFVVTATFHFTVNANGTLTSTVDRFSIVCRG